MKRITLRALVLATILASAALVATPAIFTAVPASAGSSCISDNDNGIWCDGDDDKDGLDDSSCCPIPGFQLDANDQPDYSNVVGQVYYRGVLWKKAAAQSAVATSGGGATSNAAETAVAAPVVVVAPATFDAPRVTGAHNSITVEWSAPADSAGIQLYTVELTGAAEKAVDVNTLSYTFENLEPGEYIIQVTAGTDSGELFESEESEPVVLDGIEEATVSAELDAIPTALTATSDASGFGAAVLGGLAVLGLGALLYHYLIASRRRVPLPLGTAATP